MKCFGLIAALALTGVTFAATDGTTRDVHKYLQEEMRKAGIPGMQVAVVRGSKIVMLDSIGLADVERGVPVTNDTVFQINSLAKAFTGVSLMQLVESGQLDLAAPLSRYLDGLPQSWRNVTVVQLATHISGLPDIMDSTTARLIDNITDPEAAWSRVQMLPVEFPRGEKFSYNQTNYLLLGKIIDRITGKPFTQFIQQRQLDVVGMAHTVYGDDRDIISKSATTYTFMRSVDGRWQKTDQLNKVHLEIPEFLRTAAGFNTTAQELARWIIALQQGKLLQDSVSLRTLWTPGTLNDGSYSPFALGWPVLDRPAHRVYVLTGGGKVALAVYPDDGLSVIILTNLSQDGPRAFLDKVAAYYVPGIGALLQ